MLLRACRRCCPQPRVAQISLSGLVCTKSILSSRRQPGASSLETVFGRARRALSHAVLAHPFSLKPRRSNRTLAIRSAGVRNYICPISTRQRAGVNILVGPGTLAHRGAGSRSLQLCCHKGGQSRPPLPRGDRRTNTSCNAAPRSGARDEFGEIVERCRHAVYVVTLFDARGDVFCDDRDLSGVIV